MRTFILPLLLACSVAYTAQANPIDSLQYLLKQDQASPDRCRQLIELARALHSKDLRKALPYAQEALQLAEQLGIDSLRARACNMLGLVHTDLDEYEQGMAYLLQSLQLSEALGDPTQLSRIYNSIGLFYYSRSLHPTAIDYLNTSLDYARQASREKTASLILNNLGAAYQEMGEWSTALDYFEQSLAIKEHTGTEVERAHTRLNIGSLHLQMGQLDEALRYLRETEALFEAEQLNAELALNKRLLGEIYTQKNLFEIAEIHLTEAEKFARIIDSKKYLYLTFQKLSGLYKEQGRTAPALYYHERYVHLKDSIFNTSNSQEVENVRLEYEKERKRHTALLQKQQIELLRKKQKINQLLMVAALMLLLIVLLLARLRHQRQKSKHQAEQKVLAAREELALQRLEHKNKELTATALQLIQKNDQLGQLKDQLEQVRQNAHPKDQYALDQLSRYVDYSFNLDEDWKRFRIIFEQTHQSFFDNIRREYPQLSPSEVKLSALLKLGFSSKQIANLLGITHESVRTARSRLRKKMKLTREVNLVAFMQEM